MTIARLSAGLVVVGWLVAGALGSGCSGADDSSTVGGDSQSAQGPSVPPSTTVTAGPNVPIPTGTVTAGPNIPTPTATVTIGPVIPPALLYPGIDEPQKACQQLFAGSSFQGYLIEPVGDHGCPDISSSEGIWEEDSGDCTEAYCRSGFTAIGKAFYVGSAPLVTCRYLQPASEATPKDLYKSLETAVSYPEAFARDIQGILCAKLSGPPLPAGPIPDDLAPIPVCRKCSQANANKVSKPKLAFVPTVGRPRPAAPEPGRAFVAEWPRERGAVTTDRARDVSSKRPDPRDVDPNIDVVYEWAHAS